MSEAERRFLDASVAVWRAIDAGGEYRGLEVTERGVRLREEERAAWDAYKTELDTGRESDGGDEKVSDEH